MFELGKPFLHLIGQILEAQTALVGVGRPTTHWSGRELVFLPSLIVRNLQFHFFPGTKC